MWLSLDVCTDMQFKPDVVLANWAIVHRLWHHTLEEFDVFLKRLARQLDGMIEEDAHRPRYVNMARERRYFGRLRYVARSAFS